MTRHIDELMQTPRLNVPDDFSHWLMRELPTAPPPRFRRYDVKKIRKLALLITGLLGIMFACPVF